MANDTRKLAVSKCPTYGEIFDVSYEVCINTWVKKTSLIRPFLKRFC
jgi:hypothetical protein